MMTTAVVCLAHGSRHPGADPAVARISAAVAQLTGVETFSAHLDFSPRNLTVVARTLVARGFRRAVVVPLLFTRAFHVRHDVPRALAEATAATGLGFQVTEGVGTGPDVVALLASRVPTGSSHLIVYSVGSSVAGANETVADLAARVGDAVGVDAELITATGRGNTGPEALLAAVWRVGGRPPRLVPADSDRGADAHPATIAGSVGPIHVAPLFIAPGTLWDAARGVLDGGVAVGAAPSPSPSPGSDPDSGSGARVVTAGVPLDVAVAPLVAARARPYISTAR